MVWLKRVVITLILLAAVGAAALYATGNGPMVKIVWDVITGAPDKPFDPAAQPGAQPDYADTANWAALPGRDDLADLVPAGVRNTFAPGAAPVDVFFVHPTGFLKGSSWTFSMNAETSTEENTRWMMANQASPYNGCCNVYAPRYRQASMFTYMQNDDALRDAVLGFAYQDVARAFDYYLAHFNQGRPFILASHSQGTHHSVELLRRKISGTPLREQLVAAFLIGGYMETHRLDGLQDIPVCNAADQLACIVHWDTYSVARKGSLEHADIVCVNPLSWKQNGPWVGKDKHAGAVRTSGEYHAEFSGDDAARGVQFAPLGAPLAHYVEAECADGRLYITDQSDNDFGRRGSMGDSYHGLDYAMFYMDIRNNAILRANTYLRAHSR